MPDGNVWPENDGSKLVTAYIEQIHDALLLKAFKSALADPDTTVDVAHDASRFDIETRCICVDHDDEGLAILQAIERERAKALR